MVVRVLVPREKVEDKIQDEVNLQTEVDRVRRAVDVHVVPHANGDQEGHVEERHRLHQVPGLPEVCLGRDGVPPRNVLGVLDLGHVPLVVELVVVALGHMEELICSDKALAKHGQHAFPQFWLPILARARFAPARLFPLVAVRMKVAVVLPAHPPRLLRQLRRLLRLLLRLMTVLVVAAGTDFLGLCPLYQSHLRSSAWRTGRFTSRYARH